MNIAIVIENYQPFGGGNERSTEQIVERLIARGHSVTVLTNRGPDTPPAHSPTTIAADGPKTSSARGLRRFARWARHQLDTGRFDVSMSVTLAVPADVVQPRGGTARETLRRNVATRRPLIARQLKRLAIAINPKQRALLAAERRTLTDPRVKRVIAISQYVADQLDVHYQVPAARIVRIPNAAAIASYDAGKRAALRAKMRQSLNLADDDVAFLFAAVNPRLKGIDPLLEAMAQAKRAKLPAMLLSAGSMSYGYQRRAEKLGIRDRLRWLGPTRQIDALYAAADVTVLPTYYDPSSKVVLESLLHGIPAISTRYNGASQWIVDPTGQTPWTSALGGNATPPTTSVPAAGMVIDAPDDVPALADAMAALCDASHRQRCSEAARQRDPALEMDVHVEHLEAVLTEASGLKHC